MTGAARKLATASTAKTAAPKVAAAGHRRATPAQLRARAKLIAEILVHNPAPPEERIETIRRSWKV